MKKLLALVFTLIFALTLTACGASEVDKVLDDFEAWGDECVEIIEEIKEDPTNTELYNELEVLVAEGEEIQERMENLKDTIVSEEESEEFLARAKAVQQKVDAALSGLY